MCLVNPIRLSCTEHLITICTGASLCHLCVPLHHVGNLLLIGEPMVQLDGMVQGLEGGRLAEILGAELLVVLQHTPRTVHRLPVPATTVLQFSISLEPPVNLFPLNPSLKCALPSVIV